MMKRETVWSVAVRLAVVAWCVVAVAAPAAEAVVAEAVYEVETRPGVKVPMRDGVELVGNLFLPKAEGKFPTILMRTPYGKGAPKGGEGQLLASRGYAYLAQDCRGRGDSGGEWEPFANEPRDGADTHRWILDQPWSDGTIGTTGGSYVGFTQWASAPGAGEYLKAMFPVVPLVDPYEDVAYVGGAYQLALLMGWGAGMSKSTVVRGWTGDDWPGAFRTLPLRTWDSAIGVEVPYLRDWVAHPHYDDYWRRSSIRDRKHEITTPIYVVCGWYDLFAKSVFDHVGAVRERSQSEDARRHQHILMGPWSHGISRNGKVGSVDFGEDSVINLGAVSYTHLRAHETRR